MARKDRKVLTYEYVSSIPIKWDYDLNKLVWDGLKAKNKIALNGKVAGHCPSYGYRQVRYQGRCLLAHRLAYVLFTGKDLDGELDHINGDRDDNRKCNLRIASNSMQQRNCCIRKDNKSGVTGVRVMSTKSGKVRYRASIRLGLSNISLGTYGTLSEAAQARKAAEVEYGFHPNHGRADEHAYENQAYHRK